jgi:putative ABC transport system permease protein
MVLRDGARPVLDGLIIGLLFGVLGRGVVRYSLGQASVQLFDPAGFSIVAILLAIAAVLACYLPARRASRVDPNVALREN